MASDNETFAEIVKRVRRDCNSYPLPTAAAEMLKLVREIEAAHKREVAELRLAIDAEKARHTDDYKDERIRSQDAEIKTLKGEVAELRECLKDAVESHCEGCNDFVDGKQMCEPCECKARKWSKALKGANDDSPSN